MNSRTIIAVVCCALCTGVAHAQSTAAPASKGFVEAVAQSAFGNVTSQSYGVELGLNVRPSLQVFVEGGQTRNVATASLSSGAQLIAGGLSQSQSNVGFSVKEPVTFGAAGVRYLVPVAGKAQPYVLGGAGIAQVKQEVAFTVGGTDVTANLASLGVVLGTDLADTFTKPMIEFGAGVSYPLWQQLAVDVSVRYARILAEGQGINVTRAGIGIGARF